MSSYHRKGGRRYTSIDDSIKTTTPKDAESRVVVWEKNVDFVIVYRRSAINDEAYSKLETFIINLEDKGFILDSENYTLNENIHFVKIHAPRNILVKYAELFRIDLKYHSTDFKPPATEPIKCMANELLVPNEKSTIYDISTHLHERINPLDFTSAEKNLIIYKVLLNNAFGSKKYDLGIDKLITKNIVEDAFPLHDGDFAWDEENSETANDRQLLLRFWANFSCWNKQQPLDLIERYYGSEIAFYFAWLGHYNKFLIIASIMGTLLFIVGMSTFQFAFGVYGDEVCKSKNIICPACHDKECVYSFVNQSCLNAYFAQFFDNPASIAFAVLMSLWATLFLEMWKRQESILQMRWNLRNVATDIVIRPEHGEKMKYRMLSPITGKIESYLPVHIKCWRFTITTAVVCLLLLLMAVGILEVLIYVEIRHLMLRKTSRQGSLKFLANITASSISLCVILVLEQGYHIVAQFLTKLENPRTYNDYDNSYIYKTYCLAFINNYSVIFYVAFFRGKFYDYPGSKKMWGKMQEILMDTCPVSGCILELCVQFVTCLIGKNILVTLCQFIFPKIRKRLIQISTAKKIVAAVVENRWEKDYSLNDTTTHQLTEEYLSMVIQYGFVIFFVAAFPFAPLIGLLNNIFELRIDAIKLVTEYRRPIAHRVANLGPWNGILQAVTSIGIVTNTVVITFTSQFIEREVYRYRYNTDLKGFFNTTMSKFLISEYPINFSKRHDEEFCLYPGRRYPPDDKNRYQLTDDFWYYFTAKVIAVVIIEHIFMLASGILAYSIPDVPFSVKAQIIYQRDNFKEMRKQALNENYLKKKRGEKQTIFAGILPEK